MTISNLLSTLVLSLLVWQAHACSCVGPITVENSLAQTPVAVRTFVLSTAASTGDGINGFEYRPTFVFQVYKGCNVKKTLWIKTGKNSALCGANISRWFTYVLFGYMRTEVVPGGYGEQQVLSVSTCNANKKSWSMSREDRALLSQDPPSCNAQCESNMDCDGTEYCSQGKCLAQGSCVTDDDCYNPANTLGGSFILCLASKTCTPAGTCNTECCNAVQCLVDPCSVITPTEDFDVCVADYCDGCGARVFNSRGEIVSQR